MAPWVEISIDAIRTDTMAISVFNIPLITLQPSGLKSLLINRKEIIHQGNFETIEVKANYHLVITCR